MVQDFQKVFEYNDWANNKLVSGLSEQNIIDVTVLRLFSHIVLSEQIWILRIEEENYSGKNFWEILTLEECKTIIIENRRKYKTIIDKMDLSKTITYKNSKGIQYNNSVYDILTHVSFHSAYHRGQVAKEIRRLNKEPALTDYIAFIRERYS
ncbi:MAG: DinB family protein [Ignavibacteriaceae bacterium]